MERAIAIVNTPTEIAVSSDVDGARESTSFLVASTARRADARLASSVSRTLIMGRVSGRRFPGGPRGLGNFDYFESRRCRNGVVTRVDTALPALPPLKNSFADAVVRNMRVV